MSEDDTLTPQQAAAWAHLHGCKLYRDPVDGLYALVRETSAIWLHRENLTIEKLRSPRRWEIIWRQPVSGRSEEILP